MYQTFQKTGAVALVGVIVLLMLTIACNAPVSVPTATPLPTYTPYPTATPQPTYTSYPTPTPAPTATPTPTPAPPATPTPTPTPTPEPQPGIGVTREQVESRFSKAGFEFDENWLNDGRYSTSGSKSGNGNLIELIGPSENLNQATLVLLDFPTEFTRYNRNTALIGVATYLAFLQEVFPEWPEANDWVSTSIRQLGGSGERSTTHGDKILRVKDSRDLIGWLLIVVEPE